MQPLEKVHVGLIGCGQISTLHAPGYLEHQRAELTAICDRDEALLERRRLEWKPRKAYRDYEQLLAEIGPETRPMVRVGGE